MATSKATTKDDLNQSAEAPAEDYTVVIGPSGTETTVPNSILETLLDSGYKRKK